MENKEKVLIAALKVIAECKGKTLLGEYCNSELDIDKEKERQYEKGANAAFEECAGIATSVLEAIKFQEARKPDCYKCEYRGAIPGDCHSCCNHPVFGSVPSNPLLALMAKRSGTSPTIIGVGGIVVKGNPHGIKNGWFCHPFNFDPLWLEECNGFKQKEVKDETHIKG